MGDLSLSSKIGFSNKKVYIYKEGGRRRQGGGGRGGVNRVYLCLDWGFVPCSMKYECSLVVKFIK